MTAAEIERLKAQSTWFRGGGGARLRIARFAPRAGAARGSVIVSPGRTEPIEKYVEVAEDLTARGFTVLVHDWRGQGLSDRLHVDPQRGHARGLRPFLQDYERLLDHAAALLPQPWLALGHSMGGGLLAVSLAQGETRFAGAILSAPMLQIDTRERSAAQVRFTARLMRACGRGGESPFPPHRFEDERFEDNILTHDRVRWERWRSRLTHAPDLRLGAATWGWLAFAFELTSLVRRADAMESIRTPLVAVAAGDDRLCVSAATATALARAPRARHVEVPGAWHEILMESDTFRDVFWAEFDRLADEVVG